MTPHIPVVMYSPKKHCTGAEPVFSAPTCKVVGPSADSCCSGTVIAAWWPLLVPEDTWLSLTYSTHSAKAPSHPYCMENGEFVCSVMETNICQVTDYPNPVFLRRVPQAEVAVSF